MLSSDGGLPAFFNGLEPRIGSPDPKVLKDMAADHQERADANVEFTTGNYSVVTTSDIEWKFVFEPETAIRWPIEERLMNDPATKQHMRKLLPVEILQRRMDLQNKRLEAIGETDRLTWAEVVGGRMYTGPMFVKYNGLLRGLDSPVPFLKNSMIQLCCAKEVSDRFMGEAKTWQAASGSLPYEAARKQLNFYTTTIHVINSCIVKMGKLTVAGAADDPPSHLRGVGSGHRADGRHTVGSDREASEVPLVRRRRRRGGSRPRGNVGSPARAARQIYTRGAHRSRGRTARGCRAVVPTLRSVLRCKQKLPGRHMGRHRGAYRSLDGSIRTAAPDHHLRELSRNAAADMGASGRRESTHTGPCLHLGAGCRLPGEAKQPPEP